MCFSAEVSFIAAAVLTGIGSFILFKKEYRKERLLIALIPFLFAFQQLNEGIVWLGEDGHKIAQFLYLFFALAFWPLYIPLSLVIGEKINGRKALLWLLIGCGVVWCFQSLEMLLHYNIDVTTRQYSLYYVDVGNDTLKRIGYTLLTVGPFFISSIPYMYVLGIALALSNIITVFFFNYAFLSVWCFFSALLSIIVYLILSYEYKSIQDQTHKSLE